MTYQTIYSVVGVDEKTDKFYGIFDHFSDEEVAIEYIELLKYNPSYKDKKFLLIKGGVDYKHSSRLL